MKRNLFTIVAGLLIGFSATAQYDVKLCERDGWAVVDYTKSYKAIKGFTVRECMSMDDVVGRAYGDQHFPSQYTVNWSADGNEMIIDFTKGNNDWWSSNWEAVTLNMQQFYNWTGYTSKFAKITEECGEEPILQEKPMSQEGMVVDFSNPSNAYVTFEYKLTSSTNSKVWLQFELIDILGRSSNADESGELSFVTGYVNTTDEWVSMTLSWDTFFIDEPNTFLTTLQPTKQDEYGKLMLFDNYSPEFMGVNNPCQGIVPVSLATDKICGIKITFPSGYTDQSGDKKTLTIKNLQFGKSAEPRCFENVFMADVYRGDNDCICKGGSIKLPSGAELEVINGVVHSEGTIVVTTITGQVVATAQEKFDTNSLKGGIYIIKAAEGTARIIK